MKEIELLKIARAKLKAEGWVHWSPQWAWGKRWDVFEVFDIIAARGRSVKYIQITSIQHISDRRKKILAFYHSANVAIPNAYIWAYNPKYNKFKIEKI